MLLLLLLHQIVLLMLAVLAWLAIWAALTLALTAHRVGAVEPD